MTRKDYEMVAKAIKRQVDRGILDPNECDILEDLALELAGEFAADNPRFDTKRFLAACGVEA